jgi:Guanylate kinase
MGKIFYLMGKSASGKDTIYKRLLEECPKLCPLITYTTRPIRDGETQGIEYHFVSQEELKRFQEEGKIIELRVYETVAGPWSYATVDDGMLEDNSKDYLAIGTLESYEKMKNYFGDDIVIPIYIAIEDGIRLERALMREKQQREPNYTEMCRRFLADEEDFSLEKLGHCGIKKVYLNEDLEDCIAEIREIL